MRFLYVKTLRRPYLPEHIPFPKLPRQLPVVLNPDEVQRAIDSAENLMRRTMVMTLYSIGIRCSELCHLKVSDIDSERMIIHIHKGKGGRDRDVLLSPKLLDTLRKYWRSMKPQTYLFPDTVNNRRADVAITPKVVWKAVNEAGKRAGISTRVAPHLLRRAWGYYTTFSSPFILKTIDLDRREFVEVYGRQDVPPSLLVALQSGLLVYQRLGGKEDSSASDAQPEAQRLRLEAME